MRKILDIRYLSLGHESRAASDELVARPNAQGGSAITAQNALIFVNFCKFLPISCNFSEFFTIFTNFLHFF